jgi:putative Mg2+ transporter-C (MgtC) family protein
MLSLEQMVIRLVVAMVLGAIIGLERELIGKEAGIRTCMMVSAGAAIFAIVSITLPYIVALSPANLSDVIARNSGFLAVVANVVVGIGFLGAGIIIKTEERVRGVTTAALIWVCASIGVLVGLGMTWFGIIAALLITATLYILRNVNVGKKVEEKNKAQ